MDQRPNLLRSYKFLELYSARAGVKNIPGLMWHRLSVLGELASESHDGFGAWSWAHISCGAHLPLRSYFAQFCVKVGIAPFQLIPPSYKLLAGWYVWSKLKGIEVPSLEEILFFYEVKPHPMRRYPEKKNFFRLEKYPDVKCPTFQNPQVRDLQKYWL